MKIQMFVNYYTISQEVKFKSNSILQNQYEKLGLHPFINY